MAQPQQQTVDIAQLPIQQLSQLNKQLDGELEFLKNSVQQLKLAQNKYQESKSCVDDLAKERLGKKILVPLTSSLYVPGELSDNSSVLVDIGTNYYIERPMDKASEYFGRKVEYINSQVEKVTPALQEKMRLKQVTVEILQQRVQQQMQQQAKK